MEIDRTLLILGGILLIIVAVLVFSHGGGAGVSGGFSRGTSYVSQYAGGGCGR